MSFFNRSLLPASMRLVAAATVLVLCAGSASAQEVCDQEALLSRPIPLGISGGSIKSLVKVQREEECFGGTLGALVEDARNQYILSNNHVLARLNAGKKGEGIVEPGLEDSVCQTNKRDIVATLSRFVKVATGKKSLNQVDAAIALVSPNSVGAEILNIGSISSVLAAPSLGLAVQKMGRSSCLTEGTITAVSVNAIINESELRPASKNLIANYTHQIMINNGFGTFASPGDSGSLVVTESSCPQPVGLLFAGGDGVVLANPIGAVTSALGVNFVGGCSASTPAPAVESAAIGGVTDALVQEAASKRDAHSAELEAVPGMIGTGIAAGDEPGQATIELYVLHATSAVRAAAPDEIDGVPVRLVEKSPFVLY
jgi:hypothetical protein